MRRRIFVAINLDSGTINRIEKLAKEIKENLPEKVQKVSRFISSKSWHLTISFLGYQDEDNILKIIKALRDTVKNFQPQEITLNEVVYGPEKDGRARMIWLKGDEKISHELSRLKIALEDNLEKNSVSFRRETRRFDLHLTLARFSVALQKNNERQSIGRLFDLKFVAVSLDLMESELKRGGAEYTVLQKFPFKLNSAFD